MASSSSSTAVRSWRTAFLTLRDETLTSPGGATSTHQLIHQLIFSHSHSLISAASELPAHEVTSDLLFLLELVVATGSHDMSATLTHTSHLIHDVCLRVSFELNPSSWTLILDSFAKMLEYLIHTPDSLDSIMECLDTIKLIYSLFICNHNAIATCIIMQCIPQSRYPFLLLCIPCTNFPSSCLRRLTSIYHRKCSSSQHIQLLKFLLRVISSSHAELLCSFRSIRNQRRAAEMGKRMPRFSRLWEVQTVAFAMLGEIVSRDGSSIPVDVWKSMIEVFRKVMDFLASKSLLVEDNLMSRFYASLLHCLHLALKDPKCSLADHVTGFVAALRMFFTYGLESRTQHTYPADGNQDKELRIMSKSSLEEPKKVDHSPYRPPHLRKKDTSNMKQKKAQNPQSFSDQESSMVDFTSSDSDYSDSDGSVKETETVRNSKVRVAAIVCIQVREFESLEHPLFEITLNMRTYSVIRKTSYVQNMSLLAIRIQFQNVPFLVQIITCLSDWDNLVEHGYSRMPGELLPTVITSLQTRINEGFSFKSDHTGLLAAAVSCLTAALSTSPSLQVREMLLEEISTGLLEAEKKSGVIFTIFQYSEQLTSPNVCFESLQALRAVSHNYPNIMFACWERVSSIVYGFLMIATPDVPARPWKGNAGDIVGVIGEKVLTAAVKVLDECLRAISGFKGTEDLFDDKVTPFTSDCLRMKKVSSAPSYELDSSEVSKNEAKACEAGTEQWCEAIEKHMPLTLWHTSAMVGFLCSLLDSGAARPLRYLSQTTRHRRWSSRTLSAHQASPVTISAPPRLLGGSPGLAVSRSRLDLDLDLPPPIDGEDFLTSSFRKVLPFDLNLHRDLRLEPDVFNNVSYLESSKDIWDTLHLMYSSEENITRIHELYQDMFSLQQGDRSIEEYFSLLQGMWDELNVYQPLSTDLQKQQKYREEFRVAKFLSGLKPDLDPIRSQILSGKDIPTVRETYARVRRAAISSSGVKDERSALVGHYDTPQGERGDHSSRRGTHNGRGGRAWANHATVDGDNSTPSEEQVLISKAEYDSILQRASSSSMVASGNTCLHSSSSPSWVIDSGASDHMTGNSSLLSNISDPCSPFSVTVANGTKTPVQGIGTVSTPNLTFSNVLYLPEFPFNLLSVHKLTVALHCSIAFFPSYCVFQDLKTKRTIGGGFEKDGLYYFRPFHTSIPSALRSSVSPYQWHCRLGHPSFLNLQKLVPSLSDFSSFNCETCELSKHHRATFKLRNDEPCLHPFELVHSDVWGPARTTGLCGARYFVTFIDDHSRLTWVYVLKDRSQLFATFQSFYAEISNQFNAKLLAFRTDNAREYTESSFQEFLTSRGIIHQTSCVRTPQQNGIAERKNGPILAIARALMLQMHVPKSFWADAVLTATYLLNRMPSRVLKGKSPFEILFADKSPFSVPLKVFGCVSFVHNLNPSRDKLDPRAHKCIFLGYSRTQKGYREDSYRNLSYLVLLFLHLFPLLHRLHLSLRFMFVVDIKDAPLVPPQVESPPLPPSSASTSADPPLPQSTSDLDLPIALRKSKRTCTDHPISNFVSFDHLSSSFKAFSLSVSSIVVPKSYREALSHPGWRKAMEEEMHALDLNHTWDLVHKPAGTSIVGCRWVFTVKQNPNGSVDRLKARLVAKGFTQTYGLDYTETFSPVAKLNSIRIIISLAANLDWPLHQLDVKNAFLHGDLNETVYMAQPPGFESKGEYVCHLKKSIYGLKQSPRAWFDKFSKAVVSHGMTRSQADHSVFFKKTKTGIVILVVYVDDIVITGSDKEGIQILINHLSSSFLTKYLGKLRYFLGIEVARSKAGISLSQRKYTLDILQDTGYLGSKPVATPMESNLKLMPDEGEFIDDPDTYRRLVGKLIYLTITRPDISYAVSVVSQFMTNPRVPHMNAVIRILKYLKNAPGRGLFYRSSGHLRIEGYTDADWAGSPSDRKSTTGYCTFIGGNLVTWRSKKQSVVARSSAEAEYRAMASFHFNPVFHERTKHIEVDCHFVRSKVESKDIITPFVPSGSQLADIFTKALPKNAIDSICSKLGVRAASVTCFAGITSSVFISLMEEKQDFILSSLINASVYDEVPSVRSSACRAIGVISCFPQVSQSAEILAKFTHAVEINTRDPLVSVRITASWALANICDSIRHCVDDFQPKQCKGGLEIKSNAVRALGNLSRFVKYTFLSGACDKLMDYTGLSQKISGNEVFPSSSNMKGSHVSNSFHPASMGDSCWLERMVQAFISCVTTGNVKVQWNVCHALSNLFLNETLRLQDMDWAPSVFSILLLLLRNSSNFKIRIQAAAALAVPASMYDYGKSFPDVIQGLEHIIENLGSDQISAPSSFKYRVALEKQV
uniref:Integrase catalytic domain-containing protein n=1 Tax=Fagus sylvatica TaxID=28930 RepID=A0A2N9IEJ3_FAGSY